MPMALRKAQVQQSKRPSFWIRPPVALLNLLLAGIALWLGMSIPSYFRSVSPLVLEAASTGTTTLAQLARQHLERGRPGLALPLLGLIPGEGAEEVNQLRSEAGRILKSYPAYRWSGGPAPFYEQFVQQAQFLREDETALIPSLLPGEHRLALHSFLTQSPNRNVHLILRTDQLSGWKRFYPVYSTSGQPLEATLLAVALLEQAGALPPALRNDLLKAANGALEDEPASLDELESAYISVLTLGRRAGWLEMKELVGAVPSIRELLFMAQQVQEDSRRKDLFLAMVQMGTPLAPAADYLHRHGERGWEGFETAIKMGSGAVEALLAFDKPLYRPPRFWERLPAQVTSGQHRLKGFAEGYPRMAIVCRVLAFGLCGTFLVGALRVLILGPSVAGGNERRLLINLDSLTGSVLVTILVWVLIEPGLLDFRPNEQGSLQIKLAQVLPDDPLEQIETATSTMLDQVTILVLLLFFVAQLLVFIFGLLKIAEIRRHGSDPQTKLHLLDNEEVLFDLGLYVGLGGTVASLILVVLNIVDASLMAAYASTLFGIIFVAILKIGFLRPFRRQLILSQS
jgi:hypothetical protein